MTTNPNADKAGLDTPMNSAPRTGQALRVAEGESKAADFLARLQAQQANPDELALIIAAMYGAALRGFCGVITKALGVNHA